jgi:hypothetical protein
MNPARKSLVTSTFSGMFLWGVIASIAPLGKSWPFVPDTGIFRILLVVIGPSFSLFGSFLMGFVSDYIGRRKIFIATIALYSIGLAVISLSYSVFSLLFGIALSHFGVAGEEIPTISLLAEDSTKESRGSLVTNGMNFSNIGSAFIAGVFLFISLGNFPLLYQRLAIGIMAILLVCLIIYSRIKLPESFRWLGVKGRGKESSQLSKELDIETSDNEGNHPSRPFSLRYFVLGSMALSQYLTFGLMAYIIPYYEFSSATKIDYLVFFGLLGASIAGPFAGRLISSGRKLFTLLSFAGGLFSVLMILLVVNSLGNLLVYVPLLFVNMVFSEFAWAARTTLEPELFRTGTRGRGIALVRVIPMVAYPITIVLFANFSLGQEIVSNIILWIIGLAGAAVWFFYGYETKKMELDHRPESSGI